MKKEGKPEVPKSRFPQWGTPVWYIVVTIVLIWIWQGALTQITVKEIPYSEFKQRIARGEVTEAKVGATDITGLIKSKPGLQPLTNGMTNLPPDFSFRTTRVEDPKLVEELEKADVRFVGLRPNMMTQLIMWWLLPIGIMLVLWNIIVRK